MLYLVSRTAGALSLSIPAVIDSILPQIRTLSILI